MTWPPYLRKNLFFLKYTCAILLLSAFVIQTFSKSFIVAGYYANTGAYAKNCENKARPKMHCNGKCQMMKKLKQEENKDKQNPGRKSDNKEDIFSARPFYTTTEFKPIDIRIIYPSSTGARAVDRSYSFFHPPAA